MTRIPLISVAVAATLGLAACEPTTSSTPGASIPTGPYVLVGIGSDTVPQRNVGMTIEANGSITGQAPCNSYTSQNNATWPQVSLAGIASTRRACITEGGESAYFAALEQVAQASLSDGDLELRGPAHKMRFTAE